MASTSVSLDCGCWLCNGEPLSALMLRGDARNERRRYTDGSFISMRSDSHLRARCAVFVTFFVAILRRSEILGPIEGSTKARMLRRVRRFMGAVPLLPSLDDWPGNFAWEPCCRVTCIMKVTLIAC